MRYANAVKEIIIKEAEPKDARGIREVEYATWMDTYPSEESGITPKDIDWYFNDFKKGLDCITYPLEVLEIYSES